MGDRCLNGCFSVYIVLSVLSHISELVTNSLLAYFLFTSATARDTWFALVMGILLIPLVLVQLMSAILLLRRRGDKMTACEAVIMAFLHLTQLGFIWRHFTVLRQRDLSVKKADMAELFLLRMTYAYASGFPLMLVQGYLIFDNVQLSANCVLYAAAGTTLMSTTWALASFRRQHETCDPENIILTWPGSVFRLTWRGGEIAARIISLSLFSVLYFNWLFLVIGLHWLTMLVCVCTAVFSAVSESDSSKFYKVSFRAVVAYMYVFAFINFSQQNSMFRYIMFYIIMFLENATLCLIWMLQESSGEAGYRYLIVFITATCFLMGIVSLIVYYKFFHVSSSNVPSDAKSLMCVKEGCINCKLSLCVKHKMILQRPFSAGWYSQYSEAVYNGHYYKNLLQDSMLDSVSEMDVKSAGCGIYKPGTISEESNTSIVRDSHLDVEKRSVVSFQSVGTYMHKRYINTDSSDILDDDLQSNFSSVPPFFGPLTQMGSDSSQSLGTRRWVAPPGRSASQTCLLTDNWDSISQVNADDTYPSLPSCRSLMRDDHNWYSDGYTTDNTLEWSKLPVTVLSKKRRVVSDSESEFYCECKKTGRSSRANKTHRSRPRNYRRGSLEDPRVKCAKWIKKPELMHMPVTDFSGKYHPRSKSADRLKTFRERNKPAWALDSSEKIMSLEEWSRSASSSKRVPPLLDICDHLVEESLTNWNQQKYSGKDSCQFVDDRTGSRLFVNSKRQGRHGRVFTDSESEFSLPVSRIRRPKSATRSRADATSPQAANKPAQRRKLTQQTVMSRREKDATSKATVLLETTGKPKSSTDSGLGQPDGDSEYVPMVRQSKPLRKTENIYENQAFAGDSDDVFVDSVKFTSETPWYVCSESEDSALPQETLSSSNCGITISDHESDDGLELII